MSGSKREVYIHIGCDKIVFLKKRCEMSNLTLQTKNALFLAVLLVSSINKSCHSPRYIVKRTCKMKRQTSKIAKIVFSLPDEAGNSTIKVTAEEKTEVELEIDVKHDMTMRWILNILDENHIGGTNRHRIIH